MTAALVAVNHARAQILAPHHEVDPWAGLGMGGGRARRPRRRTGRLVNRPAAP